jgi:hypothetical protein
MVIVKWYTTCFYYWIKYLFMVYFRGVGGVLGHVDDV